MMYLEKSDNFGKSKTAEPKHYHIDLLTILRILRRRKWLMIGILSITVLITYLTVQTITPQYKATAALLIDTRRVQVLNIEPVVMPVPVDLNIIQSEVDALSSRSLANRIIEKLDLATDPEFNPAVREPSVFAAFYPSRWFGAEWQSLLDLMLSFSRNTAARDTDRGDTHNAEMVDVFLDKLSVSNDRRSYTIWIGFQSESPVKAARIVNALVEQYIAEKVDEKVQIISRADEWLDERLGKLRDKVHQSEMAAQEFRERWSLRKTKEQTISDQQLSELNTELVKAQVELATAEAKLRGAKQLLESKSLDSVSQVLTSPVIQKLTEQRATVRARQAQIESELGPRHPSTLAIQAELKDLDTLLQREADKIVRALESEVRVETTRAEALAKSLQALQAERGERSQMEVQLAQLEREAQADRSFYETSLNRFKQISEGRKVENPEVKLISPGTVPAKPSSPKKAAILGMSATTSLFFSIFLIVLLERLNNRFQSMFEVEKLTQVPNGHIIPELPRHVRASPHDYVLRRPTSAYAEALQTVRTELKLTAPGAAGKRGAGQCLAILVMSAIPGEGKSAFATSLARLVARSGLKVVLIDADLRRASATASLGLSCDGGLEAVVAKEQTLIEAMHTDHETGLDILPCKPSRNNPLDILSSAGMSDLLSHIRREYHVVFIDTPPVAVVADAMTLAPLVDSTIFLIRWDSTPRDLALSCLHRLRRGGTEIASTLLTRVDLRKQVKYGTDRYGFYYRPSQANEHAVMKRSLRKMIAGVALLIGSGAVAWHLLPGEISAPVLPERTSEGMENTGPPLLLAQAEKREHPNSRAEQAPPAVEAAPPVLPEATSPSSPADIDSAAPVAPSGTAKRALAAEPQTPRAPLSPAAGDAEIAFLRARGDELLAVADIVSARMFYSRAASLGSAAAMTALAGTYDPLLAVSRNVWNFQRPKPHEAISWYKRAAAAGDANAAQRLRLLMESLRRSGQLDADYAGALLDTGGWQAK